MQKDYNTIEQMKDSLKNRTFGKTVIDALDNLPETKTAVMIKTSDTYSSPVKWNFYDPLDDNKKTELMESIVHNGILSPIIVWEVDFDSVEDEYSADEVDVYDFVGNRYLILAGHNRVDAFNKLYELTKDDKYIKIPAFVIGRDKLDIDSAKEIVVDTNYVQRVLSTKEVVKSVMYKYAEIEKNKTKKGRIKDIVAEELGLSPTTVFNYMKLSEVIQQLQDMVYDNKLNLTSILKIADKTQDTQRWMYDTYKDVLSSKLLNKVKPYMKKSDIEKLFNKELEPKIKTKKVTIEIPEHLEEKLKELVKNLIYRDKEEQ